MASMSSASVTPFCLLGQAEVVGQLLGVRAGGEGRDREQAAFLRGELLAGPDLAEQDVVGQTHQLGGELAELLLGSGRLRLVVHRWPSLLVGVGSAVIAGSSRKVAALAGPAAMGST